MKVKHTKKLAASLFASALLFAGIGAPVASAQQVGLVNVEIGDITILRDVDVALAATVVANVCANVGNVNVVALAIVDDIENTGTFVCRQKGSGRSVAVTEA